MSRRPLFKNGIFSIKFAVRLSIHYTSKYPSLLLRLSDYLEINANYFWWIQPRNSSPREPEALSIPYDRLYSNFYNFFYTPDLAVVDLGNIPDVMWCTGSEIARSRDARRYSPTRYLYRTAFARTMEAQNAADVCIAARNVQVSDEISR